VYYKNWRFHVERSEEIRKNSKKFRAKYGNTPWDKENHKFYSDNLKKCVFTVLCANGVKHKDESTVNRKSIYCLPKEVLLDNVLPFLHYMSFE